MFSALLGISPKYLLDWRTQLVPFVWYAYVHLADRGFSADLWFERLLILLLSYVVFVSVILVAKAFWLDRAVEKDRFWAIVFVLILAGFLRGLVFAWLLESLDFTGAEEFWYRVAASVLNGATSTLLAAAAFTAVSEHADQVKELRQEQRRLTYLRDVLIPESITAHRKLVDATKRNLGRIFQSLKGSDDQRFLDIIKQTIDEVVRPISYDLERNLPEPIESKAQKVESRLDWRAVLRSSTGPGAIRPVELSLFLSLAVLPAASYKFGYFIAAQVFVYLLTAGFLAVWLAGKLVDPLLRVKSVWIRLALFIGSLSAVNALMNLGSILITRGTADPYYFWNFSPLFFAASGLAIAIGRSVLEQSKLIRANMLRVTRDLAWDTARARELQRQRQRNLARALHGSIQASLASSYLKASAKAKQGSLSASYKSKMANDLLDRLSQIDSASPVPLSLSAVLDQLRATWDGIATIHIETSPFIGDALATDPVCLTAVVDIVPELAFNAVKHGNAQHIFIAVRRLSEREIEVEVANDGDATGLGAKSGLGTQLLSDTSLEWSRSTADGLVNVRAVLPYLPTSAQTVT